MKEKIMSRKWLWATLLFGALAVAIALRGTSLWPDEGITYGVIRQSFSDFVRSLADISAGAAQCGMLLYICFEWLWVHIFGMSELAMRASNVVLMIPFMLYAAKSLKKLNLSPWYMALFALNSMFIFYINDARPYVLLAGMGMAFFYYAILGDLNAPQVVVKLHIFFLLGMLTHMMFLFAFTAYLLRCLMLYRKGRLKLGLQLKVLACFLAVYLLVAAYYLYVFTHANEVNNESANPIMCIGQIFYYLAGFSGLGLNRIHLRDCMFDQLTLRHVLQMGAMVLAYLGMLVYTCRAALRKPADEDQDTPSPGQLLAITLFALLMFILGNIVTGTLFWARHCIWLLPFVLVMICLLIQGMLSSGKTIYRAFAVFMIVMQLASAGMAMLDPYYAKDDYKGVVQWFDNLQENESYTLLFMGQESVFEYYGWTAANRDGTAANVSESLGKKVLINNFTSEGIQEAMNNYPGLYYLVLNQKNRFDENNVYDLYEGDTQFQSFKIARVQID